MNTNNTFTTSDIALATALVVKGFPILKLERELSGRRVTFVFEQSSEINETTNKFWQKKLAVEPSAYFHELKDIKTRLYSE